MVPTEGTLPLPKVLTVTLGPDGAVATRVTPGATVIWLGASQGREDWTDHFYSWRLTTVDDDRDGTVAYGRKGGFPSETVLVAVDVAAGAFAVGATYPLSGSIPAPAFESPVFDPSGALVAFSHRGPRVDLLVVRPTTSAWASRIVDGTALDADGLVDGAVGVALSTVAPRGGSGAALDGIRTGDIVAMVDAKGPSVRVGRYATE